MSTGNKHAQSFKVLFMKEVFTASNKLNIYNSLAGFRLSYHIHF